MTLHTSTTIPGFAPALQAACEAATALSGVLVRDGIPAPGEIDAKEWIAFLDVDFEQSPKGMNVTTRPREERYEQNVLISVVQATRKDQASASVRAWDLFIAVEQAIRSNPRLVGFYTGDGQLISVQVGKGRFTKKATPTERESAISFSIRVHARI